MNPGTAIYNLLKDSATVGAIIGNKIYPVIIPERVAYPAVTYSEFSQQFDETKDGPIPNGDHSFEIDIYCEENGQGKRLADAIKGVLSWYSGTVNGVSIERIRFLDQSDDLYGDDKEIFHITQEYSIRVGA